MGGAAEESKKEGKKERETERRDGDRGVKKNQLVTFILVS